MRKSLPVLTLAALVSVGVAQAQQASAPRTSGLGKIEQVQRVGDVRPAARLAPESGSNRVASMRPNEKLRRTLMSIGVGDSLFPTVYDFQTNGGMPDRIINWPGAEGLGGIMSTIAYMAAYPTSDDRGTYGAIRADLGGGTPTWQSMDFSAPFERLESVRSGFNEVDHLTDGRLVIASHNGTTINILVENAAGTGTFTERTITGSDGGLWPRVDVGGGDVINVIWTESVDEPPIVYARSTDMGATFSAPVILGGPGATELPNRNGEASAAPQGMGADTYVVSAAGNHVAIWYETGSVGLYQLRSTDGGASWMQSGYVAQPAQLRFVRGDGTGACDTCFFPDPEETRNDTVAFRSDTASAPGSSFDMLITDDGTIFGVYPIMPTYVIRRYFASGDSAGIIYQADFGYTNIGARSVWVDAADNFTATGDLNQPGGLDNTTEILDGRSYVGGLSRWMQLGMDANRNVYVAFASGENTDFVATNNPTLEDTVTVHNYLRSHIYAAWTRDGEFWSEPMNLTPAGVDAQYPSLANLVDEELHVAYQADTYPGDLLTSSGSGGSTLHPDIESVIMAYIFGASTLPEPSQGSVRDDNNADASGSVLGAYPNPTNGRTEVVYSLTGTQKVSMRVVNSLGQEVMSLVNGVSLPAGKHSVSFDASKLTSGTYFVVTSIGDALTATPLNIAR
jgi:hypothetical protein